MTTPNWYEKAAAVNQSSPPTLRPKWQSMTMQGGVVLLIGAVSAIADDYGLWDQLHLDVMHKIVVDFGAAIVLSVIGSMGVYFGRVRAGGLK